MIDYAFYPVRTMKPLGYLGPISQEWLDDNKGVGCPHPHITSDHFSLLAELGLCPDGFPENEPSSRPPAVSTAVTSSFMGGGGLGNFGGGGGGGGGHASGRMFHSHGFGGFGGPHNGGGGGGGGVVGQRWEVMRTAAATELSSAGTTSG